MIDLHTDNPNPIPTDYFDTFSSSSAICNLFIKII